MISILIFLRTLLPALELSAAIAPLKDAQHLTEEQRFQYAFYMVEASQETSLDPYLIASVMWHESRFQDGVRSRTNDFGLMQVHWQKLHPQLGENWLVGLTKETLMDPRNNIFSGARELAHKRRFCRRKRHDPEDHPWWAHHKWGNVVKSPDYGLAIQKKRERLLRSRGKIQKPHRSRGPTPTS